MNIFKSERLKQRETGIAILRKLIDDKNKCLIIHYSCESFITSHGKTPRITSISIRNLGSGQVKSFSIHLQAQFNNIDFNNLKIDQYDELEKQMLNEFSKFANKHKTYKWIHWNMRDSNYGFEAIKNRIRILKGKLFEIEDDQKIDFPKILGLIYTFGYEKNKPKGRLLNLAYRNNMSSINALTGKEEADSFENKEYLKLHLSTLRKVDIIDIIISKAGDGTLKVEPKLKTIYGLSIVGIFEIIKQTPWLLIVISLIGYVIGSALEPVIQDLFGTG